MRTKKHLKLGALALMFVLNACAVAIDDSVASACVGNCPNFDTSASAKQYGEVADTGRVGDSTPPVRMLETSKIVSDKPAAKTATSEEWYPWWSRKTNISRAALADAFEKGDKSILRVPVETYIRELGNLGLTVPQEPKAFAEWLRSSRQVEEVPCTRELLKKHYLSRSSKDGKTVDMKWAGRQSCYGGEKFLVFVRDDKTEQPFLSLGCGNILTPKPAKKASEGSLPFTPVGLIMAETMETRGCPREEKSSLMNLAQHKIGEDVVAVTHCILKPVGPAHGVVWNHEDRKKFGIPYRWKRLVKEGIPVNVATVTGYRFSGMAVKKGQYVRFVAFPAGSVFEVSVLEDGIVEMSKDLVSFGVGRTVLFFPRSIVTEKSVMKWRTEGVSICYPSDGADNYTRGPLGSKPSELFRAVGRGDKNFTVVFSITCGGST